MKVAICLMFKNEHKHLPDFINYHKSIGVDDFIIYDNNSTPPVESNDPHVIVKRWADDEAAKQQRAYAHCLNNSGKAYDWIGFIDTDEFVVLKKHNSIKDLLMEYNEHGALGLNWLCFGSSKLDTFSSHSEFYMHCDPSNPVNRHIKSFVKTSAIKTCVVYPNILVNDKHIIKNMPLINGNYILVDPHYFGVDTVDTQFNKITGPFSDHTRDVCYIKHCLVRTKADVEEKKIRGRGDGPGANPLYFDWDDLEKTYNSSTEEKIIWSFR